MNKPTLSILAVLAAVACGGASTEAPLSPEEERELTQAIVAANEDQIDAVEVAPIDAESTPVVLAPEREPGQPGQPGQPDDGIDGDITVPFALRRGETLTHFARWSEIPVEDIADISSLDLEDLHAVGTAIQLPLTAEQRSHVEEQRERHRVRRVEGYLASRGGSVGVEFHRVRTGESAWSIARDAHGMPVWLIEAYNPSIDLERLRPGQELQVPLLADTVVDAASDK